MTPLLGVGYVGQCLAGRLALSPAHAALQDEDVVHDAGKLRFEVGQVLGAPSQHQRRPALLDGANQILSV